MRKEIWTDENGFRRISMLRDNDPPHMASRGIPIEIPLDDLDWEEVKKRLNNALIDRGIYTIEEVSRNQEALTGAVLYALRRPILELYKESARKEKENGPT